MENQEYYPIYVRLGANSDTGWQFHLPEGVLEINGYEQEIQSILENSNGYKSAQEIEDKLANSVKNPDLVHKIIKDLSSLGILVDSRQQHANFHELTLNPSPYGWVHSMKDIVSITSNEVFVPKLGQKIKPEVIRTNTNDLLAERVSIRNFENLPVDIAKIGTILDSAYSANKRPVPSAGALYPLRIYALIKDNGSNVPPGYYQYDHNDQTLIKFQDDIDWQKLSHIFNSEDLLFNSSTIFVIAADLDRHASKYANRGYRYTLLEAGHAAQNMHITAKELDLGSLEYGGFNDNKLADELELEGNEKPIITIAIGYKSDKENHSLSESLLKLEEYVGVNKPIEWVKINGKVEESNQLDFYQATAKYQPPSKIYKKDAELYSTGTARSIEMASIKAIAEGYERFVAGKYRYDIKEAAVSLTTEWLSPSDIKPLSDLQYQQLPRLSKFDPEQAIQWVYGNKVDGGRVLLPVDLIYYPLTKDQLGRKPIVESDSSGMAAHEIYDEAVKNALLELIERDAIMRLWLKRQTPDRINHNVLPSHFQKRNKYWQNNGRKAEVLDLSHDGIAIVNVVIRSPQGAYPYFVSGASASTDSFESALSKAYQESELGVVNALLANKKAEWVKPEDVRSPEDHGSFYYYDYFKEEVEWLWSGDILNKIPEVWKNVDLNALFDPIIYRFTDESEPLQVVRALSKKLIPINFGFGNEHYAHPELGLIVYKSKAPHFFA